MGQEWYVRFPDREAGPYSSGELRRLVAEGSVSPDVPISLNRQRWIEASKIRGLFVQNPAPPPSPDAATEAVDDLPGGDVTATKGNIPSGILGAAREMAKRAGESAQAKKAKVAIDNVLESAKGLGARARDFARSDEANELADRAIGKAKEVSSRAKGQAANAARRAKETAAATMPFWRKFLRELKETAITTGQFTTSLFRYGYGFSRMPILRRRAREAQIAYGHRMFEGGLGDENIRGQIATLADRIKSVGAAKGPTKVLEAEKRGLLIRLADPALAEGVAPEEAAAQSEALAARKAIEDQQRYTTAAWLAMKPSGPAGWLRVGIGLGAAACTIGILGLVVTNHQLESPERDERGSVIGRVDAQSKTNSGRSGIDQLTTVADPYNEKVVSSNEIIREERGGSITWNDFAQEVGKRAPSRRRPDPEGRPRTAGLPGIDPSVAEVLKPTSDVYQKGGFKDYEFGKTPDELKGRIRSDDVEDDKWVKAEGARLLFDEGRLRGIRCTYSGDNQGYLDAVRGEFGAARNEDIMTFSGVKQIPRGATREDLTHASYRFPRTLVLQQQGISCIRRGAG